MSDDDLCEKCGEEIKSDCGGRGHVRVETDGPFKTFRRCPGLMRKKFRDHVGDAIYEAEIIDSSPLLEHVGEDVVIRSNREKFRSHLRYVLARQGFTYFFRLLTDSDVLDAWLSKHETTEEGRGSTPVGYYNLRDAVDGPDLLIVNIGTQTSRNRALPSVLHQVARKRSFQGKPTWFRIPRKATIKGVMLTHLEDGVSTTTEFERYVEERFVQIDIGDRSSADDNESESGSGANQDVMSNLDV